MATVCCSSAMAWSKRKNCCEAGMLSLYRTLSLPYLRQRWSRAILVVASIALGVATLVATRALNQTMSQAVRVASAPLAGAADLHVSNGESPVRRNLAADLRQIPGVKGV